MEKMLDVDENELWETVENYGRDPKKEITTDETMLLARTIHTLHEKHNYAYDDIAYLLPRSKMSGSSAVEIKKLLGELYTGTIDVARLERIPKNFTDLVKMVQERNDCSKGEAMKHIWKSFSDSIDQKRVRHIESMTQKQQSLKEQSVDIDKTLFLALEKVTEESMVYKLSRDILSIRIRDPDRIVDREVVPAMELAEELVKKGWMSLGK